MRKVQAMPKETITTKAPCAKDTIFSPPHDFEIVDKVEQRGWFGSSKVRVFRKCKACGLLSEAP
jgi:hypothetical protein